MMSLFDENLQTVKEVFGVSPELFALSAPSLAEIRQTPAGPPALFVAGRLVHSARGPEKEAARLVQAAYTAAREAGDSAGGLNNEAARNAAAIVILLGFGLGYAAREAARLIPHSLILIVERRPEVFRAALENARWTAFFTRHKAILMLNAEPDAVFAALKAAETALCAPQHTAPCNAPRAAPPLVVVKNAALCEYDREWYRAVEQNIGIWRRQRAINAATQKRFGARWARNREANRAAFRLPGVKRLWGALAADGFPALLLAAGPSLSALLPHMAALRQRFVIVAVDTALRFTRRAGIEPDVVVAVDPQYINSRHLDRRGAAANTIYLFETAIYAPLLRSFDLSKGNVFLCAAGASESAADDGGKGTLAAGGSVATSAWDFCRLLTGKDAASGPAELWIAGLDLSFPALKTHYKGAFFEERAVSAGCRFKPAETAAFGALHALPLFSAPAAGGGTVKTDARLSLYAAWFGEAFSRHPQTRHYHLSTGGLAIKGLETATIAQALSKKPVRPALDAALSALIGRHGK